MLSSEGISEKLHTKWAGRNILYKDITDSTNNDARQLAIEGAAHGSLVVADKQEAGRGSNGRGWETPAGTNIAMSLVVRPKVGPERIPMLTLVMGLSVAEGIDLALKESGAADGDEESMRNGSVESIAIDGDKEAMHHVSAESDSMAGAGWTGSCCRIKWPNDVIINGRKVCGILTELHMAPKGGIEDAIIGVGINVNMVDFPKEIEGVAGSLLSQTGCRVDRSLVVARVMERFEENFEKFEKTSDLSLLKDSYEARLVNKGERVMLLDTKRAGVVSGEKEVEEMFLKSRDEQGEALGITDTGALTIRLDSGEIRDVNAGEVSVRGLYGYV